MAILLRTIVFGPCVIQDSELFLAPFRFPSIVKKVIQNELDQIKQSIDNIVENTELNTIKVLRPPVVSAPTGSISGKTDIVFLIDSTGSMGGPIDNVKNNITDFVNSISSAGVNIQLGLVDYNDGIDSKVYPFTTDLEEFKNLLNTISVSGGGDIP